MRVRPIAKVPCWDFVILRDTMRKALGQRQVGSSTVHDQSSRTHAVLELEIVTQKLVEARNIVIERESELVLVGKRTTDILVEEQTKGVILLLGETPGWKKNPDYESNQERMDEASAELRKYEQRVVEAEHAVTQLVEGLESPACLGGKMVFVDLAGAEYQQDNASDSATMKSQSPQERQEGRQVNTDLLALKEGIRARANGQKRIPHRNSPLTRVLREHFEDTGSASAMNLTVSPAMPKRKRLSTL